MYTVKELIETLKQCPQDYEVIANTGDDIYTVFTIGIDHESKRVDIFGD